jgi:FlaA1/EpsC-like NDP-sugar epimerase
LIEKGCAQTIQPVVADILDAPRMRWLFNQYHPQVVFHAAAHKHVPMMESQPGEAIKNNTLGTAHLAELSRQFGVERFVMISTDKAINPTNVMGATKRLAEIYVQALHARFPQATKFMAVRFGNVLGSSGSVIPRFKAQIAAGGPVKVTHPEITRYFMTIPEAVGLVLQCGTQGNGGEIFVLDMGKPVRIVDLARQLIELSGFKPGVDIEIEFVGLRPGEKLFEELSYQGENYLATQHPKIMRFTAKPYCYDEILAFLDNLTDALYDTEPDELKLLVKKAVPEYQPYLNPAPSGLTTHKFSDHKTTEDMLLRGAA